MSIEEEQRGAPVRGREVGSQIAGVFGALFVWINSAAIPAPTRAHLLAAAGAALAAIVVLSIRSYRQQAEASDDLTEHPDMPRTDGRSPFSRRYWAIVAIEAIALFAGSRIITELGYPELGVAWVAVVVGTHFFALAAVFRLTRFHVLGVIVTALGLAGFALRALDQVDPIAIVSGVTAGFTLLGFGLRAFASTRRAA